MARCFVTRQLPGPALDRLATTHEVEVWPDRLPPSYEVLRTRMSHVDGLLSLLSDRIDQELIDACPNLKAISNYALGCDNIDLDAATRRGIPVGHTPDVLTAATADLTFALLLSAARKIPEAVQAVRDGDWLTWEPGKYLGREVYGMTLGIIGMGRIGSAVAKRARGFDMNVIHSGRGTGLAREDVLDRADFVSIHCPLTPQTRHLIDRAALGRMLPTAILINTARGPIVDQQALLEALIKHTIAGAALDVTDPEPPADNDALRGAPNLLITPHIGSATQAARERMADLAVDNLIAALDSRPMPHQANRID